MRPDELLKVVSLLLDAARLTEIQKYEFLGRLGATIVAGVPSAPPIASKEAVPQSTAAPAPAPSIPSGKVMIPQGFDCECDMCHTTVYRITRDVLENMPKKDFVDSFKPLGSAPTLLMPLDTWADASGNISIDCPLCKGRKSLWIKGHGDMPFNDYPETTGPEMNAQ